MQLCAGLVLFFQARPPASTLYEHNDNNTNTDIASIDTTSSNVNKLDHSLDNTKDNHLQSSVAVVCRPGTLLQARPPASVPDDPHIKKFNELHNKLYTESRNLNRNSNNSKF